MGSLDTTHVLCTVHIVSHSETKNYIKCIEYFLSKIFSKAMRAWEIHQGDFLQGTFSFCSSPASLVCSRDVGLVSWDLKICIMGHIHLQSKDVHGDLSGLPCLSLPCEGEDTGAMGNRYEISDMKEALIFSAVPPLPCLCHVKERTWVPWGAGMK